MRSLAPCDRAIYAPLASAKHPRLETSAVQARRLHGSVSSLGSVDPGQRTTSAWPLMATSVAGDAIPRSKEGVPQWDGNSVTFTRYKEEALLWQEGVPWHKRYTCGPKLMAELQGSARRHILGQPYIGILPSMLETQMEKNMDN